MYMLPLQLGTVVITPGALEALGNDFDKTFEYLRRHAMYDWGDLDDMDKAVNNDAVQHNERVLSMYKISDDVKIWIITEADRSVTTVLLPSEY